MHILKHLQQIGLGAGVAVAFLAGSPALLMRKEMTASDVVEITGGETIVASQRRAGM